MYFAMTGKGKILTRGLHGSCITNRLFPKNSSIINLL